ncbi:MAG: hypothetical protein V3W34_13000 [Phycisphaerae bacterium]
MTDRRGPTYRRRGMVLPMMLLILVLLGVMAASSAFYVHADLSATQSIALRFQARLAAQAGLQKVMLNLRTDQADVDAWYHNPEQYHRVIVWGQELNDEELGTNQEFEEVSPIYRFSVVADNPNDDEKLVRYGVTDESSKLNINVAGRGQLLALLSQVVLDDEINIDELVDALIDWRDADTVPGPFGVESEYYARLDPPYAVKNAPFDTVEELLLVRGFDGALLYGEDYDRNGLMSPNEDDGDETFPPDDADNMLHLGLYPYITVASRSLNRASDNSPRTYIFGDRSAISEALSEVVDDRNKINYISESGTANPRITTPAGLLKPRLLGEDGGQQQQTEVFSPITLEDMEWVMDLLTTSMQQEFVGRININTAARQVLAVLPALEEEDIDAILEARGELGPEQKRSTGWVAPIVGVDKFVAIAPLITTRGSRFHVEVMGYGDHVGTMVRLEAIIEMRGPVAQMVYNRDITMLGTSYPIRYFEGDPDLVGFTR